MSILPPKRKTLGYWPMLLIGTLLSCVLMNAITISYQRARFRSWIPLSSPPSEAKRIVDAEDSQVWVEAQDGRFFTADISFYCRDSHICSDWETLPNMAKIPQHEFSRVQAEDCKKLPNATWPFYATGKIVECVYAHEANRVLGLGDEGYYALMANGDVFYWRNVRSPTTMPAFFIFSTLVFPWLVGAIITAVYPVIYILARLRSTG